jgi:hypothetical protein
MLLNPSLTDPSAPVREEHLKFPTLLVLAKAQQAKLSGLTSNELVQALESITTMSAADREVTPGDRVSRFRRQALNLISHGTLQDAGLIGSRPAKTSEADQSRRYFLTSKGRTAVAKEMISAIGMPSSARPAASPDSRTGEKAIAKPALFILATLEMAMQGPVPMTTLRRALRSVLPKSEEDLAILKNRKDARIDQVIRNLISNQTLTKEGWIKRHDTGAMSLTNAGYSVVLDPLLKRVPTPPMFLRPAPTLSEAVAQTQATEAAPVTEAPQARRATPRPR